MMKAILIIFCATGLGFELVAAEGEAAAPLTLKEAQATALRNHPRISVAELRALAASQVTREAQAAFYPNLSANVVAVGTADDNTRLAAVGALNNPAIFDRNAEGLILSQLITDFGRTANLSRSAKLRAQAERDNVQATQAQILLQVAAAFYATLKAEAVLRVAEQTVANRRTFLDQVTELAKNKLRSDLDLSFATVSLAEGNLLLSGAKNDAKGAFTALFTLMSLREPKAYTLVEDPAPPAVSTNDSALVQQALESRPDLLRLRAERDAALRYAKAERALHFPTIAAVGSAGIAPIRDTSLPEKYAAGGLVLNLPLFAGNLYSARQKEAELRAQAAEEVLRDEENTVIRDVRLALLSAQNALERSRIAAQLLDNARLAFNLAQARYSNGASSIVELNQAQLNQISAEITQANTRYEYLLQRAVLNYQTGAPR